MAAGKGRFSPELLHKIKDAVNIIEVVGEHVVLRKSGSNYSGLCPFHQERSPSFSVSEQKQLYHCYGCKKGGDLVSFVQDLHGISFMEAIEELADRAKVALPKDFGGGGDAGEDPEVAQRRAAAREKLNLAWKLNRFVAAYYHQSLPGLAHVGEYLRKRGVTDELVRSFYLGGSPASWDALATHLVAKKAPLPLATELGLIKPSPRERQGGPGYFDLFRNRAMFPILDMRGKVAGFGGRALALPPGAPDTGAGANSARGGSNEGQPKYLNSSESLVFHKGKIAYGLYQAQKHVRETDEVILVEGYFDVLAMHAAGFRNVVATCGTALTPDHLTLFRRLGSRVTVLFDGDRAGISATERAMEVGLDHGMVLYGAAMPAGLDPDELLFDPETGAPLPEGVERMRSILAASQPLLDQRIAAEVQSAAAGPEARTQAIKRVAAWLHRFKDPVGREVRVQSLRQTLGVTVDLLARAVGAEPPRGGQRVPSAPQPRPAGQAAGAQRPVRLGKKDLILLKALTQPRFQPFFAESRVKLPPGSGLHELFDVAAARAWAAELFEKTGGLENLKQSPNQILEAVGDPQVRSVLTEALVTGESGLEEAEVKQALNRAIARSWARFSQQIKTALADAEAKKDAGLARQLMQEYLDVQRKMKEFSSFYDEA